MQHESCTRSTAPYGAGLHSRESRGGRDGRLADWSVDSLGLDLGLAKAMLHLIAASCGRQRLAASLEQQQQQQEEGGAGGGQRQEAVRYRPGQQFNIKVDKHFDHGS